MKRYRLVKSFLGTGFLISLLRAGEDDFQIVYGQQSKSGLTRDQATRELGACIMHALECDGKLD